MTKKTDASVAQAKAQEKQKRLLASYRKKEEWMRWAVIIAIILILLLLLLLGFATDWTRGLHKDSVSTGTPVTSNLDSLRTETGTATPASTQSSQSGSATESSGSTGTSTEKTSTTTTNTSTTTTNNNTTTPSQPTSGLLQLYGDSSAGDSISDITQNANLLGVSHTCHNETLIQVCEFTDGSNVITTKNLLGTGLVTSVLKNFQ